MQKMYTFAAKAAAGGDFANCGAQSSYAGMCDALKQCGTLNLNLLNIQIQN
jgi:hypothetical protein